MKRMIAAGLVGLALGLVMPGVLAQAPQAEVQKWEQFCEIHTHSRKLRQEVNARAKTHGTQGYQLVSGSTYAQNNTSILLCYRRPAR